jgi:hypothetical protein
MKANAETTTSLARRGAAPIRAIEHVRQARDHLAAALAAVPGGNPVDDAVRVDFGAMIRALAAASKEADGDMRDRLLGDFVPSGSDDYRPLFGIHFRAELSVMRVGRIDTRRLREAEPKIAERYAVESIERRVAFRAR